MIIVSNRLPFHVKVQQNQLSFERSAGGLVSGISSYLDSLTGSTSQDIDYTWVGWPGFTVPEKLKRILQSQAASEFQAHPVFLAESAMEKFYHGFCNKTIWPLFHYFPSYCTYEEECWEIYKDVNEAFANSVLEVIQPDDVIWVHDYHLMLLPRILRKKLRNPIGFFLHIPFPSYELYRLLPGKWRAEILEGMLGADLIGFHTYSYTQYFLGSVLRVLGLDHNMGQVYLKGRLAGVDTFPMGIDFKKYNAAAMSPEVGEKSRELKTRLKDSKLILSVDRLDYSKGILNRLEAYEIFLENNIDWREKVVLLLVVVPSRIGLEHYQKIKKRIDEMVGRINGKFGSLNWSPILYQYRFLPLNELSALYRSSDVALITPMRDGMNLIAKEYLASRSDGTGVLILSEVAGAAGELGESIIVNPNDLEEVVAGLKKALEMSEHEQVNRNQIMRQRLARYDVVRWASDFLKKLHSIRESQAKSDSKLFSRTMTDDFVKDYQNASNRLILLDYDGTLVPFVMRLEDARPGKELLDALNRLSRTSSVDLVVASGRDRKTLDRWLGQLSIGLIAENGIWMKKSGNGWRVTTQLTPNWKPQIFPILEVFMDRLPGAFIEEKEYSLVWHYRKADPESGSILAKELADYLINITANMNLQVTQGSKIIEIGNAGISKGVAAGFWLSEKKYDSILAIGDDMTDEDLFKALPESAYTIKVGTSQSHARLYVESYLEVLTLLNRLVQIEATL
jgi:trehalose 6-phosphate synthase/phosphatase